MISKPPELGDKDPATWIREFLGYFQHVRFEFMRVISQWYPAQSSEQHGTHPGDQITAGNSAYISLLIPREVQQIKEAVIRLIPSGTGTIDWTANISLGGKDEDESARTATKTADTLAVTDDQITEIDVTSLFDEAQANNQAGLKFTLDAVATTTDVYVLGLYFKYK